MTMTETKTALPAVSPKASMATLSDDDLAKRINDHHKAIEKCLKDFIDYERSAKRNVIEEALKAGELLIEMKKREGHGNFKVWLTKHCEFSERTAQRYIAIRQDWPKIEKWLQDNSASVADLSLRQAERLITDQSTKPSPPDKQQQANGDEAETATVEEVETIQSEIEAHRERLLGKLKTLRQSDERMAMAEARTTVKHLRLLDLIEAAS